MPAHIKSLELHGIPAETLREYLAGLGGEPRADGAIAGPGWVARITRRPDYPLGRAALCCFLVEMEGDEEVWKRFVVKIARPGG